MAVDEALLRALQQGLCPITVRFYTWRPAAVSLGYFQDVEGAVDLGAVRELGLGLVRRPTGGRAILHDDELTYSIVIPADALPGGRSIGRSYRAISSALARGLRLLGLHASMGGEKAGRDTLPAACFALATRADLAVEGAKVIGSAQVRRGGVILQHGSIPITLDLQVHERLFGRGAGALRHRAAGIAQLLGRRPGLEELVEAFTRGFEEQFQVRLEPGELTQAEVAVAEELAEAKYRRDEYNLVAPGSEPARREGRCE